MKGTKLAAADVARNPIRSLRNSWRISIVGAVVLFLVDSLALAGVPIDPVPDPRVRPDYAPRATAAAAPAKAGPAVAIRRTARRGDTLANINDYFNSFRTMEGQFIQVGPHGEQSEGRFYISRPGKIRFDYDPPVRLDVISDGRNVAVRNGRTATQDFYPLRKTPLRYLLADRIDLTSGVVNEVREENDLVALIIIEDSRLIQGKLTLIFNRNTYELRQWIVTDGRGLNTSVAVYNTTTGGRPDPGLFRINYYE
ncbi:outer-membrane lipoprotein carrier protein LolA [Bauldia sp.]|uniref:outer-membrane lipoprotein carrier protein LolA n=1 Tax=Bauldia sp. TaxID=2575872 RepID=UPI003BA99206